MRGTRVRCASSGRERPASAGGSNRTRGRGHGRGRAGRECNRIGGEESGGLPNVEGNWEKKEPTSIRFEHEQTPGPTSHFDRNTTPAQLFCHFFLQTRSGTC